MRIAFSLRVYGQQVNFLFLYAYIVNIRLTNIYVLVAVAFGRGLFNRTSALVPPTVFPSLNENAQGALNLSHPSTFRSILG